MWIWAMKIGFWFLILIAILLLSGMIYQFISTKFDEKAYPPPGKMVDIGGYRLHINCSGEGGPTVIFDAGAGCNSMEWSLVQPAVSKFTSTCSYDRAGNGWSDESPLERTSENIVYELHTLLKNANVPAPYVLVGHSFGGINVLLYANKYPNEVAGVVLVDSSHEDFLDKMPKLPKPNYNMQLFLTYVGWTRIMQTYFSTYKKSLEIFPAEVQNAYPTKTSTSMFIRTLLKEHASLDKSLKQLQLTGGKLGDKPLIVITAGKTFTAEEVGMSEKQVEEIAKVWEVLQQDLVSKSTNSKQIIANYSGHIVTREQPEIIVEAIREMIQNVKNTSSKPPRISLREITKETVWDVIQLEPADEQKKFVASNSASIAEAYFQKDYAWFRGIYSDNHPVGFVMIGMNPRDDFCFLWRFMIDKNHQNKGLGSVAIVCVLDYLKSNTNYKSIVTSYVQGVGDPSSFYKKMGFIEADESIRTTELGKHITEGGEVPLQLKFRESSEKSDSRSSKDSALNITIRKAKIEDAHVILTAEQEIAETPGYFCSQPSELSEQNVIKTIKSLAESEKGIYLVAEREGKIVGHAFLEPLHLKSICHVAQLSIGVHHGWQEKGIGTALMEELIAWAKQATSIEKIELNVRASNNRAIALYMKMGFVEEGRLKNRIKVNENHYIDDVLMALDIQ